MRVGSPSASLARLRCSPIAIGKHANSPAWHRHLRRGRARARLQVRTAKLRCSALSRKALALLSSHHSGPRDPLGMSQWQHGRGKGKYQADYQGSDYWSHWSGSPATWQKHKQKQQQQSQDKGAFPQYDARQVDVKQAERENLVQITEVRQPGTSSDATLVKDLQHLVNQARKAEQKVKRILTDQCTKQAQWSQYEKDMKQAFLKEKQRHQEALSHLEDELLRAVQVQDEARARVRTLAAGSEQSVEDQNSPCQAEDDAWAAQVADWESGNMPTDAQFSAVLQRALAGSAPAPAATVVASPATTTGPPVVTPKARISTPRSPMPKAAGPAAGSVPAAPSSRLQPFPPPRSTGLSPALSPVASDPYLHPANVLTPPGQVGLHNSGGKHRTVRIRSSIKDGAKPQGPLHLRSTSPADRSKVLDGKRAATMADMAGVGPAGFGLRSACIVNDDLDVAVAEIPPRPPELDHLE